MIEELLPFYTFKGNLLPMKHVKENVAVALLLAALIVVAFWGIELRLLLLTVVIVVIAWLAFMPAFWERIDRKKDG
ncbi:MAG: hypothetical protein ACXW1F_06505 [Halobacteriota archaeon]